MAIKIEEGKYYLDRKGRKIGPIQRVNIAGPIPYPFKANTYTYAESGEHSLSATNALDLIEEWVDEPQWVDGHAETAAYTLGNDLEMRRINGVWEHRILKRKPVVEPVFLYWNKGGHAMTYRSALHTHRITFDLVDGVPDLSTLKGVEL
jgi:hypothetical protein